MLRPAEKLSNLVTMTNTPRSSKDLAWAAGFLEGEGSFLAIYHYEKSNGGHRVSAVQKQREPLERLQNLFGGKLRVDRGIYWNWIACGPLAIQIALTLYCMMSPRRQEQIGKMLAGWKASRVTRTVWKDIGRTHCSRGHELTPENIYQRPSSYPRRECRICRQANIARYLAKKKARAA